MKTLREYNIYYWELVKMIEWNEIDDELRQHYNDERIRVDKIKWDMTRTMMKKLIRDKLP